MKKQSAEDEPTDVAGRRSPLEGAERGSKEHAVAQLEIVKQIRKLLH